MVFIAKVQILQGECEFEYMQFQLTKGVLTR